MNLASFTPTTEYTIYIAAPLERIWDALTQAELCRRYFSGFAIEMEPKIGGLFMVRAPDGSEYIAGEVVEHHPPHRLTVTWNVAWPGLVEALGPTLVSYEVAQTGEAVRLTVTESHDRPIEEDILSGGRAGWPAIMSSLKSLLENGAPLSIAMQPPIKMLEALTRLGVRVPGM